MHCGDRSIHGDGAMNRNLSTRRSNPLLDTFGPDLMVEAEATRLLLVDEVHALANPPVDLWVTKRHDHLAVQQKHLWAAKGEEVARELQATADGLSLVADAQAELIQLQRVKVKRRQEWADEAHRLLDPYSVRPRFDTARYYTAQAFLFGGDVAGGTGAAIALGEFWWLALVQMLAVGAAGVCIGLLAADVKRVRDRRSRGANHVPDGMPSHFAHLFSTPDPGEPVVRWVLLAALIALLLIAGAIAALRSVIDGPGVGLVFGGWAAAVVLGSAANAYFHGSEIDDVLDNYDRRLDDAIETARQQWEWTEVRQRADLAFRAGSLRKEAGLRGAAAAEEVTAASLKVLENNPTAAGNGTEGARSWPLDGALLKDNGKGPSNRKAEQ